MCVGGYTRVYPSVCLTQCNGIPCATLIVERTLKQQQGGG